MGNEMLTRCRHLARGLRCVLGPEVSLKPRSVLNRAGFLVVVARNDNTHRAQKISPAFETGAVVIAITVRHRLSGYDSGRKDRVMIFASLFAWATNEIRVRRTMRTLHGLSDQDLNDIGLSRGMIEGAARRQWSAEGL
jgi:uncharacterized protein YjiS (DUF1127 family)